MKDRLAQYAKLAPSIVALVYMLLVQVGVKLPLSESELLQIVLGIITIAGTYAIPNKSIPEDTPE